MGSPISFIRLSVFEKFFDTPVRSLKRNSKNYTAVNRSPIQIFGLTFSVIKLQSLPDLLVEVDFNILSNESFSTSLILGLDFFTANNVSFILNPRRDMEERVKLFSKIASAECANK